MQVILSLLGVILLGVLIVGVIKGKDEPSSPAEEAADEIMDELLQAEAPEPPPADLFVREEDVTPVTPEVIAEPEVEKIPVVKIINPTPKVEEVKAEEPAKPAKKKRHYPSKPKNKKS
jgi:outer membrane biosynthesis protein TonB